MTALPTLRQLEYLLLLVEQGSFHQAADVAGVTQPALSSGLRELERLLGAPVLERRRGDILLTPTGEEAVQRAAEILAKVEDLVDAAHIGNRALFGRFRLGIIPTVAPFLLSDGFVELKTRYPALDIRVCEDHAPALLKSLAAGKLDGVIIALPYHAPGIDHQSIGRDEIMVAAPVGHPLAGEGPLPKGMLKAEDLMLLEDGDCFRAQALALAGLEAPRNEGCVAKTLHTLIQMTASGMGVCFVPAMAIRAGLVEGLAVRVRPIASPAPARDITLGWRPGSSRAGDARLIAEALKLG